MPNGFSTWLRRRSKRRHGSGPPKDAPKDAPLDPPTTPPVPPPPYSPRRPSRIVTETPWITSRPRLQDLPGELRQQIMTYALPKHIDLGKPFPRRLLSMLLTSKQTKNDVLHALEVLNTTIIIPSPKDLPKLARLTKLVRPTTLYLSIYYHSPIPDPHIKNNLTLYGDEGLLAAWHPHLPTLPIPPSIRTIAIDLTPAPHWLLAKRSAWVAAHLNDNRVRKQFTRDWLIPRARELLPALRAVAPPNVEICVTGWFAERSRQDLSDLAAQTKTQLRASFVPSPSGGSAARHGLSLDHTARSFGVLGGAGDATSARPMANLGRVRWSSAVQSLWYENVLDDEGRTRRELGRVLGLAGRRARGEGEGEVWFEGAELVRRKLIHGLCRCLGLESESVSGDSVWTKTVRAWINPALPLPLRLGE